MPIAAKAGWNLFGIMSILKRARGWCARESRSNRRERINWNSVAGVNPTAEEGTAYATRRDVVVGCLRQADDVFAGAGHADQITGARGTSEAEKIGDPCRNVPVPARCPLGVKRACPSASANVVERCLSHCLKDACPIA